MSSSTIVLLHIFSWFLAVALVNGATFTVVNNCTQTIWPAISGTPSLNSTGFDLPQGSNRIFQAPKGWVGRLWGRTGCIFDAAGRGSCRTGDCGSGQIECNGSDSTTITLAEFSIHRSVNSLDFYKISLANGFNLPMMIEARDGSRKDCQSTGCTEEVNRLCPAELKTESGEACQNPCKATGTDRTSECGRANYLQLFKTACPMALIIPTDDASATFTCSAGNYVITFCPSLFSLQNEKCREPFQCGVIGGIGYPFWGANHPEICGFPGFELLNCGGEIPLLNIDSRVYRVLGIQHPAQTLRVARQDFRESTCPSVFYNTSFDPNLFSFPQNYSYDNATLYYDCIEDHSDHNIQFTCNINRTETLNYFAAGKGSELGYNFKCNNSISIPVSQYAIKALSDDSTSLNDLKNAFAQGFFIRWLNSIASCQGCVRSGGVCVYDPNSALINCIISQRMLVEVPTIGLPLALAPTPPYGYQSSHTDPGYGESGLSAVEKFLIGIALVVTFIVAAAFILVRHRRHKRSQLALYQDANPSVENFLLNNEHLSPKRYEYSHIKKITKSFSDKLGQGGYGSVYKGTLSNGQLVAVKVLVETKRNGEGFINEVDTISRTSHVNIVNLLGFCYEKNRRALIYEFMPNKSLDKFINTNCQLDCEVLYQIALGVARGLEYLHKGCNTMIVHFDIKPQNILLDEGFCPKISDFGLAKPCKKKQSILSMAGTRGTVGYIAPEVFARNFGVVSHKSDVYSYGMMVLEMAGAKNIVGMGSIQSSGNCFPDRIYDQLILQENKNLDDTVLSSEDEDDSIRKMFLVGFWCIQTIPSDRPSMSKVVDMLEGSLQSIQIPPKPSLFNHHKLEQAFSPSASRNMEIENSVED